jgi:hypothetical protein
MVREVAASLRKPHRTEGNYGIRTDYFYRRQTMVGSGVCCSPYCSFLRGRKFRDILNNSPADATARRPLPLVAAFACIEMRDNRHINGVGTVGHHMGE